MDWENHLIKHLQWSDSIINREAKEHVAREIAATAKDGDMIGAGSGSTVYLTLFELARRIREEHLHIEVIPASQEISMTCIQPVSYTHLTLPTNREVMISVVAASIKKKKI